MEKTLRKVSGIFTILTILADLITIGLYLNYVFMGVVPLNIESAFPWILIIVVIFIFSMLLSAYSEHNNVLDGIIGVFSWLYVILAAMLFAVISKRFIAEANYGIYEYLGYIFLIILISGLGFLLSFMTDKSLRNFTIPFMLVGLYQIILWILLFLNPQNIVFNLTFFGNSLLLGVVGCFIVFCWNNWGGKGL